MIRYGSVCSGIEAASEAWKPLGWQPQFFSEIEAFPSAVLDYHHPSVPNHGDMTKFAEWPDHAIDLLVGGTPCQSFSVAGLRAGLADPRGNLLLTYLAVAARYRPRWLVWENVPGVLSSGGGRDFGALLGGLGQLGYGFAYRVLDAQFCRALGFAGAVPQRRRRVFVVGYLGDWRRAAAVLFDAASLRGDHPPRRQAGQGVAVGALAGTSPGGGWRIGADEAAAGQLVPFLAGTVNAGAHPGSYNGQDTYNDMLVPVAHALRADGFDASEDGTGRDTPIVPVVAASLTRGAESAGKGGYAGRRQEDDVNLVAGIEVRPINTMVGLRHEALGERTGLGIGDNGDPAFTLSKAHTHAIQNGWAVRRLTPTECERLQGFPEISKSVRIEVCADAKSERAKCATLSSQAPRQEPSEPALVHVRINLERQAVEIHRAGRLLWSVSTAATPSSSPLSMPVDAFVRVAALMTTIAVPQTQHGGVGSQASISGSFPQLRGSRSVAVSGREIEELVSDVGRFTETVSRSMRFTTSPSGLNSQNSEPTLRTLSCCAAAAISSCIPSEIRSANSYAVIIETVIGYTAIPHRGKPAADGPRYKALGNSMAVNVMRVIGERIAMIDAIP